MNQDETVVNYTIDQDLFVSKLHVSYPILSNTDWVTWFWFVGCQRPRIIRLLLVVLMPSRTCLLAIPHDSALQDAYNQLQRVVSATNISSQWVKQAMKAAISMRQVSNDKLSILLCICFPILSNLLVLAEGEQGSVGPSKPVMTLQLRILDVEVAETVLFQ